MCTTEVICEGRDPCERERKRHASLVIVFADPGTLRFFWLSTAEDVRVYANLVIY